MTSCIYVMVHLRQFTLSLSEKFKLYQVLLPLRVVVFMSPFCVFIRLHFQAMYLLAPFMDKSVVLQAVSVKFASGTEMCFMQFGQKYF